MTTYTRLLRDGEVRALLTSSAALVAGNSLTGLALATLVNTATGSSLLTALSLFGPTLAQLLGGSALMSLADTGRPRRVLALSQASAALCALAQLPAGLPVGVRLGLVLLTGLLASVSGGVRYGLLSEAVGVEGYAAARSLLNVSTGAMQIAGFGSGAILLAWFTPQHLFGITAGVLALSTIGILTGVRDRSSRPVTRPGVRQTVRTNRWLFRQPALRPLLLNAWLPNGLIVGCEALFVPYAGPRAGALFVAGATGMLCGDLIVGRFLSRGRRARLGSWLRVLLAAPYLLFWFRPEPAPAVLLVAIASVGFAGTLPLQERILELTPPATRGQVQGVEGAGRMAMQGVCALTAGALAELLPTATVMTLLAGVSLLVTICSMHALRRAGSSRHGRKRPTR
ncbi:MFS transporter [Enemella evansiae]|uniref:hypothetical protein n=1 Tax=Enemella evansiae TaxID=2016499 RepID=UPI000B979DA2|nr:hypothetical protein [Enemella evansiae]OYN96983.1 hypothetical protein CGZ96_11935 [Enemella evansiae]OYO06175.1 hypothetical protein CGZ97_05905 [Enemella evansiae]PFG68905.1 hypothetical protein B0O41_3753 [Propionibacteriaceae bacterium ES.041]